MRRVLGACVPVLLIATVPLPAQQGCRDDETIGACWDRMTKAPANTLTDEARERLNGKSSELGLPSTGARSLSDFISLLAGAVGTAGTAEGEDGFAAEVDPLRLIPTGWNGPFTLKLKGILHQPTVFAPLAMAFADSIRELRVQAVEREFEDLDDIEVQAKIGFETQALGRRFARHADMASQLVAAAFDEAESDLPDFGSLILELLDAIAIRPDRQPDPQCELTDTERLRLDCLTPESRQVAEDRLEAAAAAYVTAGRIADSVLTSAGFFRLADLINNQPQIIVEGGVRVRRTVVGPNEYSGAFRIESSFTNLNTLRGSCAGDITLACLETYLARPGVRDALDRGYRWWAEGRVRRVAAYLISFPADGVLLDLDGSWSVAGSAGLGLYIGVDDNGVETGRIDFSGEVDLVLDDPMRQDQIKATLAYTHRVSDDVSLGVALVYANRPELLGDVDRKLGTSFGLRYRLAGL